MFTVSGPTRTLSTALVAVFRILASVLSASLAGRDRKFSTEKLSSRLSVLSCNEHKHHLDSTMSLNVVACRLGTFTDFLTKWMS